MSLEVYLEPKEQEYKYSTEVPFLVTTSYLVQSREQYNYQWDFDTPIHNTLSVTVINPTTQIHVTVIKRRKHFCQVICKPVSALL